MMPTLCEVAGVNAPTDRNLCGRSYLPLALNRPSKEPWRTTIFGHFRYAEMARDARYKIVLRHEGDGPNELYDLRTDPRERLNQYENEQFNLVRERLTRELEGWRKKYA
jgi:arylsulfatase A-like enzyme